MLKKLSGVNLEGSVRKLEQVELKRKQAEEELAELFAMSLDMIWLTGVIFL
jgi:hypothetical protein